jgi:hypothetical protein
LPAGLSTTLAVQVWPSPVAPVNSAPTVAEVMTGVDACVARGARLVAPNATHTNPTSTRLPIAPARPA